MEDNNLDNLFRQSIEQYAESSVDKVWGSLDAKLEKKLAEKRRRKFFWWWLFPVAVLGLLSTGGYFYFSSDNSATDKNSVPSISESKRIADDKRQGIAAPAVSNKDQIQSITESKRIAKAKHEREVKEKETAAALKNIFPPASTPTASQKSNSDLASVNTKQAADVKKPAADENIPAETNSGNLVETVAANKPEENNSGSVGQTTSGVSQSNNSSTQNSLNVVDDKAEATAPATTPENNNAKKGEQDNVVKNPADAPIPPTAATESSPENKTPGTEAKTENTRENVAAENSAAQDTASTTTADSTQATSAKKKSVKEILKTIASNTSLEIFYAPEIVSRTLSSNTSYVKQGAAENQVTNYSNEMSKYSYNMGARIRYDIGKKWSVSAGISYTAYAQTATYNYINIVSDSVYQEVHQGDEDDDDGHGHGGHHGGHHGHHTGSGGTPGVSATDHFVIYTSSGAIDLKDMPVVPGHNPNNDTIGLTSVVEYQIHFISIPVFVRYKFGTKKISYYAETGFSMNYISSDEATINIANSYTETNTLDGLKKMNFTWLLGAGAQYAINNRWRVFIGPHFRYSLGSINENNPVLSYPYFFGIKSGVAFHF